MTHSNKTYYTGQEGSARNSTKEYIQYLYISLGSIAEVDTQLLIAFKLSYLIKDKYVKLENELIDIRRMTLGLRKYLNEKSK